MHGNTRSSVLVGLSPLSQLNLVWDKQSSKWTRKLNVTNKINSTYVSGNVCLDKWKESPSINSNSKEKSIGPTLRQNISCCDHCILISICSGHLELLCGRWWVVAVSLITSYLIMRLNSNSYLDTGWPRIQRPQPQCEYKFRWFPHTQST